MKKRLLVIITIISIVITPMYSYAFGLADITNFFSNFFGGGSGGGSGNIIVRMINNMETQSKGSADTVIKNKWDEYNKTINDLKNGNYINDENLLNQTITELGKRKEKLENFFKSPTDDSNDKDGVINNISWIRGVDSFVNIYNNVSFNYEMGKIRASEDVISIENIEQINNDLKINEVNDRNMTILEGYISELNRIVSSVYNNFIENDTQYPINYKVSVSEEEEKNGDDGSRIGYFNRIKTKINSDGKSVDTILYEEASKLVGAKIGIFQTNGLNAQENISSKGEYVGYKTCGDVITNASGIDMLGNKRKYKLTITNTEQKNMKTLMEDLEKYESESDRAKKVEVGEHIVKTYYQVSSSGDNKTDYVETNGLTKKTITVSNVEKKCIDTEVIKMVCAGDGNIFNTAGSDLVFTVGGVPMFAIRLYEISHEARNDIERAIVNNESDFAEIMVSESATELCQVKVPISYISTINDDGTFEIEQGQSRLDVKERKLLNNFDDTSREAYKIDEQKTLFNMYYTNESFDMTPDHNLLCKDYLAYFYERDIDNDKFIPIGRKFRINNFTISDNGNKFNSIDEAGYWLEEQRDADGVITKSEPMTSKEYAISIYDLCDKSSYGVNGGSDVRKVLNGSNRTQEGSGEIKAKVRGVWDEYEGKWYFKITEVVESHTPELTALPKQITTVMNEKVGNGTIMDYTNRSINWTKVDNSYYCLASDNGNDMILIKNSWVKYKNDNIIEYDWVNADGIWQYQDGETGNVGWKKENGKWRFYDNNGIMIKSTTVKIDDILYTFDSNGYCN